jgi:hypothetical protein
MLFWPMTVSSIRRETFEYRGYSLQVTYATPQWQVLIDAVLGARPAIPPDRQIVRGWDEGETLKRAKMRIDLLIERPSLN